MKMTRKEFLIGTTAFAGCRWAALDDAVGGKTASPSYFCTWGVQVDLAQDTGARTRETLFPGDQGVPGARDVIDERSLFGPDGWAVTLYPRERASLYFMLDDGWDVPYGLDPWGRGDMPAFGTHVLEAKRFPSFPGTPAERLRELNRRIVDCGWRGAGVWVACQCHGDKKGAFRPDDAMREELKRKLSESAEAGIDYWKIDWGMRDLDAGFRVLVSELARAYHPALHVEHKPSCGRPILPDDFVESSDNAFNRAVLGTGDIFRTYDTLRPFDQVSTLARVAAYSRVIDRIGSRSLLNVEDALDVGAALGHTFGIMRCARTAGAAEVLRAVRWQQLAPAFGGDAAFPTRASELVLEETHRFGDDAWYSPARGKTLVQRAPAVIARGLPLPEVRPVGSERPFVVAGRNPNGAVGVCIVRRLANGAFVTPPAEVSLDVAATPGQAVALFGTVASLALRDAPATHSAFAADLADGEWHDVTAAVVRRDGRLVIDGALLAKIGVERNGADDTTSRPAVRLRFA